MARSLDRLVDFLLEEIALDGDQGVTLKEVADYVRKFYQNPPDEQNHENAFRLDEGFLAKVWQWLTNEDDIHIDDSQDLKSWSFQQLKAQYPGVLHGIVFDHDLNKDQAVVTDTSSTASTYCPRISVDTYRIHQAICGHGPDPSRVPASEYALLSVIARTREEGILQGVAGRLTGQDKRSVPKRTDSLNSKGYILKRTVLAGGQKTSRLTLKRFANHAEGSAEFLVRDFAVRIVSTLQSDQFMTQDDLATILSMTDPARRRVLNHVVSQLIRRKCLKKIKAAFAPNSKAGELKVCLRVIREPEENDWLPQDLDGVSFTASVEDTVRKAGKDLDSADADDDEILETTELGQPDNQDPRNVPQWNPDRLLTNVLWDLASNAGEEGITNTSARAHITGYSVRRPLESTLVRVAHSSLKRQPSNIQEYGVVRSSEVKDGVARYVHRTFNTFASLVQQDLADWKTLEGGGPMAKSHPRGTISARSDQPVRDKFGFFIRKPPVGQIKGLAMIEDSARVREAKTVKSKAREVLLDESINGRVSLSANPVSKYPDSNPKPASSPRNVVKVAKVSKPPVKKAASSRRFVPTGRPRKFARGTEKFWRDMLLVKKLEEDPSFSRRSGLAGLTKDAELLDWYNDRPLQFDDTVSLVLQEGLPLPYRPEDVSQSWVERMGAYLNRNGPGLFITPPGASKVLNGHYQCLITLRSNRLGELELRDRSQTPKVLFLVSSAAHTFRNLSPVAQLGKKATNKVHLKIIRKIPQLGKRPTSEPPASRESSVLDAEPRADPEPLSTSSLSHSRAEERVDADNLNTHNDDSADRLRDIAQPVVAADRPPNTPKAPPARHPTVTPRSTRSRKPTQKVVENHAELRPSPRRATTAIPESSPSHPQEIMENTQIAFDQSMDYHESTENKPAGEEQHDENGVLPPHISRPQSPVDNAPIVPDLSGPAVVSSEDTGQTQADSLPIEESVTRENQKDEVATDRNDTDEALKDNSTRSRSISPNRPVSSPDIPNGGPVQSIVDSARFVSVNSPAAEPEHVESEPEIAPPEQDVTEGPDSPAVHEQPILRGRDAVEHYKIILLELLHMCGGVIPNSPMLWRRAVRAKSFEANVDDNPAVKLLRSQMNILATRGKVKVMNFAYQRGGMNYTKAIVALPHIQLTDAPFLDMQRKMIALPVEDEYIPPELMAEIERKPSATMKRDLMASKIARAPVSKFKPQRSSPKPPRETSPVVVPNEVVSLRLSPPPVATANTGFLTLKVPKIAEIRTSSTFTSHYFDLVPVETIRFEADANEAAAQTASPLPASQRRSGVRIPRSTTYQAGQRKIQWSVPKHVALPTSLKALLSRKKDNNLLSTDLDPFERDVECARIWEASNLEFLRDPKPEEWHFINHFTPKKDFVNSCYPDELLIFKQVRFTENLQLADSLEMVESDLVEEGSWEYFCNIAAEARSKQKRADDAALKRKRKVVDVVEDGHDSDFAGSEADVPKRKSKRQKRSTEKKSATRRTSTVTSTNKRTQVASRGIGLRHMTKEAARQLIISFVIVRVLIGGLDKHVDFKLVGRLNPSETAGQLQERWKVLSKAYYTEMDAYVQDFQIKYLDALVDGKAPTVNFEDLHGTDWESILKWAVDNINTEGKDVPLDIPPTRDELLALNKIEVPEPTTMRNLYNQSQNFTMASKESIWCSTITGIANTTSMTGQFPAIEVTYAAENLQQDEDFARARSWILAAVLTKHQVYDPLKTRAKLRSLASTETACDALLTTTMKQMQADKIIVRQDSQDALTNETDGSSYSGTHGWKISRKWFDKFEMNRNITSTMLRDAVRYKTQVLDAAFGQHSQAGQQRHIDLGRAPYLADGCMVAIFNLLDQGCLEIKPGADVPASRYGLDHEDQGYKTRSMDRDVLSFSTYLQPTSAYVLGDPLAAARAVVPVPRGGLDEVDGLGLIPAWFNINHDFQPQIWDMVVGAVIGLVAVRPGISALELLRTFSWALQRPDLDMLLEYLFRCTLIEKVGEGWETTTWWWTAVGVGSVV